MTATYRRTLPLLDDVNRAFWTGGADGVLCLQRCADCRLWIHPPQPVCRLCLGENLIAEPVSGDGAVLSHTVNEKAWGPGVKTPYTIAVVALDEQAGLQLTTNIVGIDPASVRHGMRVSVVFERDEDVWLPLFRPTEPAATSMEDPS